MISIAAGYFDGITGGNRNYGFGPGAPSLSEEGNVTIPILNLQGLDEYGMFVNPVMRSPAAYAGYELEVDDHGIVTAVVLLAAADETLEDAEFCLDVQEIGAR